MEPPHTYLRETSSSVVHHQDYLNRRDDQALCGAAVANPTPLDPAAGPPAPVCAACESKLVEYHLRWWRERAETATAELEELRIKYRALAGPEDTPPADVPAQVHGDAEETPLTPFLAQARKELLDLCRQFDGAVPYWRVKNCMDAFSDKLGSDERVLLAQEIGADGSLIRWCTAHIESLGWQVTNNPVTGEAEDMMEAWTHDLYQTPKKTKWRLGRAR
ncbi:hypothetical protein [Mycobacterium sp. ACS1612]|uniref:hypothetical protein n=1 Tax=Mycobacterium sp. ACS1612 TaxID=1834117 RepID=UPI001E3C9822|nr:hypothetical protein [Mycobacterium sp. ACS1612]